MKDKPLRLDPDNYREGRSLITLFKKFHINCLINKSSQIGRGFKT